MPGILETAKYLALTTLHPMFAEGRVHFPDPAPGANIPETFHATVSSLRAAIPPDLTSAAEIKTDQVILPAGFFCERWCSGYQLLKFLRSIETALTRFDLDPPNGEKEFIWPSGVPEPWAHGDPLVDEMNKVYPFLVAATFLHEVAHALFRGQGSKKEIELKCDRFAMDYLLGELSPKEGAFRFVAMTLWMCSLCSESLGESIVPQVTHPHPVDRLLPFVTDFLHPHHMEFTRLMEALEMFCVAHIYNLARQRRNDPFESVIDEFHRTNSGDPILMLGYLKTSWTN